MKYLIRLDLEVEGEATDINDLHTKLSALKIQLPGKFRLVKLEPKTINKREPSVLVTYSGMKPRDFTRMEQRIINQCLGVAIDSNTLISEVRRKYENFYGPEVIAEVLATLIKEGILLIK